MHIYVKIESFNDKNLALEVLSVADCVEQRRCAEPLASASARHAVAAVSSFFLDFLHIFME